MLIKESIKFMKNMIKTGRIIFIDEEEKMSVQKYIDKFDEAIKQFEECTEYKEMWEELREGLNEEWGNYGRSDIHKIMDLVDDIEGKCLPKEKSKD